jgi:hypothetical protein
MDEVINEVIWGDGCDLFGSLLSRQTLLEKEYDRVDFLGLQQK